MLQVLAILDSGLDQLGAQPAHVIIHISVERFVGPSEEESRREHVWERSGGNADGPLCVKMSFSNASRLKLKLKSKSLSMPLALRKRDIR